MKYNLFVSAVALTAVGTLSACDSFVQDVDGPIDRVVSDSLDSQSQVVFLATGVKERFNDSYDGVAVLADLLSDAGVFDPNVRNSTFPTFDDIDDADIQFDNNSVDGVYDNINEYRFLADDLLRRASETIEFSGNAEGTEARRLAEFTGNFHGGIARYFLGTYFSPDETSGGAPITDDPDSPGSILSTAELYAQAQSKLEAAANLAATDYERRVINTLRARIALFSGDRAQAGTFAANGLQDSDEPYFARYSSTSVNNWWSQGGQGRTQVSVAPRFAEYDEPDNRQLVELAPPAAAGDTNPYYRQALYLNNSDPIPFITWQENALILAEVALLQENDAAEALRLINEVRENRGLEALSSVDQDALLQARDRELFTQGQRLVDQRRFNLFHIPGGWMYLPITQTERNANPNV